MAQTRDLVSVVKGINFLLRDSLAAGTHTTKAIDLRAAITSSDLTEVISRILLQVMVEFGAVGTIDISVQHSDLENSGWVENATIAQMSAADGEDFYIAEIYNLKRYVRLELTVTGTVSSIAITGSGSHAQRNPVVQIGTEQAVTLS
jgi:hypothetical protein